jgi:hypothetical protein
MTGGFVLPRFDVEVPHGGASALSHLVESDSIRSLAGLITKKRRAIIFETSLLPALYYGGFLSSLRENDKKFDVYYASSYSYIVVSLFLMAGSPIEFEKWLTYFFSEDRINKLLDITFPTAHVFKNNLVMKLAEEICGSARIEMLHDIPLAVLGQNGTKMRRLFSTGYLRDIMTASFCMYPLFEQVAIAGVGHNSGYPDFRARVEDLFRNDVDETVYVSVDNGSVMNYPEGKVVGLFGNYLRCADDRRIGGTGFDLSDVNIVLDASVKDFRIHKILDASREQADKLISSID